LITQSKNCKIFSNANWRGKLETLIVGLGGFFGAITRYLISNFLSKPNQSAFPLSTFFVNVSGCFILGLFLSLTTKTPHIDPKLKLLFTVGFVGSYTTFSTFGYETATLIKNGKLIFAIVNVAASVLVGIVSFLGGTILGQIF